MKTLLDGKRAQNLGIFLCGFHLNPKELDAKMMILPPHEGGHDSDEKGEKELGKRGEDVFLRSNSFNHSLLFAFLY